MMDQNSKIAGQIKKYNEDYNIRRKLKSDENMRHKTIICKSDTTQQTKSYVND